MLLDEGFEVVAGQIEGEREELQNSGGELCHLIVVFGRGLLEADGRVIREGLVLGETRRELAVGRVQREGKSFLGGGGKNKLL